MALVNLPQFTEVEAKIVGPLTFKQVLFVLVALAICALIYIHLPRFLSFPLIFVILVLGVPLAIGKKDELPLYIFFLAQLRLLFSPRVIFWGKKKPVTSILNEIEIKKFGKKKTKIKWGGALRNLIAKVETKK
jgi:hypothetical protein